MIRRSFITRLAMGSAVSLGAANAGDTKIVSYRIKGFSCVTCAVGLDTMLKRQDGVVDSKSTYPGAVTTIEFKTSKISEKALKSFISEMGFSVS